MTNGGRWRVIAHVNEVDAMRTYRIARWALMGGIVATLMLIIASLIVIGRFIERRITGPAQRLAIAAEAVAAGDLSKEVNEIGGDDEIGRLARGVSAMIGELRRLAMALQESATETVTMTSEITASSEEMAASAGQIAHTASDLSQQANTMAQTIQALAGSSESLVGVASELDAGARDGVDRNAKLRVLAVENRARLDDSSRSLAALTGDVEANAAAIDQLARASEEVRSFVTLVQKLARQSKLLALNAAMEAARAGDQGHGFAVVAEEVRRLAAMSSDAAERTERVVSGVLQGIAESRTSSERTVDTVRAVRGATEEGSRSFGQIERAVAETDAWTSSIALAVTATNGLAREMSTKLDSLVDGHRIVRRGDAGSGRIERRTEREHGGDRRRGRHALGSSRASRTNRGEPATRESRGGNGRAGSRIRRPAAASLTPDPHSAEHAKSRQADAALDGEDLESLVIPSSLGMTPISRGTDAESSRGTERASTSYRGTRRRGPSTRPRRSHPRRRMPGAVSLGTRATAARRPRRVFSERSRRS